MSRCYFGISLEVLHQKKKEVIFICVLNDLGVRSYVRVPMCCVLCVGGGEACVCLPHMQTYMSWALWWSTIYRS